MNAPFDMSDDTPVYVISVAAQLSGLHPQTLRAYDRMGLVCPGRAVGRGRRYSLRDILVLRQVQRLSQDEGINLSGIKRILELEAELERFRQVVADSSAEAAQLRAELESTRAVAARLAALLRSRAGGAELVPVKGLNSPRARPGSGPHPATEADGGALPAAGHTGPAAPAAPAGRATPAERADTRTASLLGSSRSERPDGRQTHP